MCNKKINLLLFNWLLWVYIKFYEYTRPQKLIPMVFALACFSYIIYWEDGATFSSSFFPLFFLESSSFLNSDLDSSSFYLYICMYVYCCYTNRADRFSDITNRFAFD